MDGIDSTSSPTSSLLAISLHLEPEVRRLNGRSWLRGKCLKSGTGPRGGVPACGGQSARTWLPSTRAGAGAGEQADRCCEEGISGAAGRRSSSYGDRAVSRGRGAARIGPPAWLRAARPHQPQPGLRTPG